MLDLCNPGSKLDAVLAALSPNYTGRGLNLPAPALERIRASNLGFYGFLYKYMFDGSGLLHVGRLEHLRVDLMQLFSSVGQPLSADMHTYINTARKRNM